MTSMTRPTLETQNSLRYKEKCDETLEIQVYHSDQTV